MAGEGIGGSDLRRITVINLDSLSEEEYALLEGLFGSRENWPVFTWDVVDQEWARDDPPTRPLNAGG